ncbi:zinc-dependent peptidase [Puia sp. P3]|uniref:zinc-dependent peptidase n=1 Tax=Puia sp. P3 TaxID=3423952 RepID=UPI003D664097
MLGDYAATNYHEFWAVAVEVFFESPVAFRHEMPDLYEAMACVLNQDPLNFISGNTTIIRRPEASKAKITATPKINGTPATTAKAAS